MIPSRATRVRGDSRIPWMLMLSILSRLAKTNRASHGPRVSPQTQVKVRVRKTKKNPKEPEVRTKVPKGVHKGNTSKAGLVRSGGA